MLKGIDISHHQRGINLSALDVDFVICKATEGVGYVDSCCDGFYQEAKKLGKKLGIYHFARPDLGNSAEAEADWFLQNIKGYIKEAILVLDWEPAKGQIANVDWAKKWLDRVYDKTGVKPILYISASPMRTYNWYSVADDDYGLWVANYGINDGNPHPEMHDRYPITYWSFYALWQYTSKGRLNGYDRNLDLNYFNGTLEAWDKYAGANIDEEKKKEEIHLKVNEEIAEEVIDGKWGNGQERYDRLTKAGYNYDEVRAIVNKKLGISQEKTYVVKRGDTLIGIAQMFNTTYQKIAKDNGIANPNKIYAGQVLVIR